MALSWTDVYTPWFTAHLDRQGCGGHKSPDGLQQGMETQVSLCVTVFKPTAAYEVPRRDDTID